MVYSSNDSSDRSRLRGSCFRTEFFRQCYQFDKKSSDIESIEQLTGEQVGYVAGAGNQEISKVQSDIDSKVMGVSYTPKNGVTTLADALYNRDVTAIIFNESYDNVLKDTDGYTNFSDDIRVIYSVDVEHLIPGTNKQDTTDETYRQRDAYSYGLSVKVAISNIDNEY